MQNRMGNDRLVAALGLVALLAGCGGGGSTTTAAQCTADCTTVNLTKSDGSPVPDAYPTAINPSDGQVCATSSNPTSSAGTTQLSLSNCGGSTAIVTAPVGVGTAVGTCTVGQSCNLSPGTTTTTAPYAGTWTAKYSSSLTTGDYGTCTVILNVGGLIVDQSDSSSVANCISSVSSSNDFTLSGYLSADGSFVGSTSAGASYKGSFSVGTTSAAGGSWTNASANTSGTWVATRTAQ